MGSKHWDGLSHAGRAQISTLCKSRSQGLIPTSRHYKLTKARCGSSSILVYIWQLCQARSSCQATVGVQDGQNRGPLLFLPSHLWSVIVHTSKPETVFFRDATSPDNLLPEMLLHLNLPWSRFAMRFVDPLDPWPVTRVYYFLGSQRSEPSNTSKVDTATWLARYFTTHTHNRDNWFGSLAYHASRTDVFDN